MSFLDKIENVIKEEKYKLHEEQIKKVEENKKRQEQIKRENELKMENKIFSEFQKQYKYGDITINEKNFKLAGKNLSFGDCLKKAYCENINESDKEKYNICKNDESFYPYLAWKSLSSKTYKGTCYLGNDENDKYDFSKNIITDGIPVYITPIQNEKKQKITDKLNIREGYAVINIVRRLQNDLGVAMRNILHEKNKQESRKDDVIKDNYNHLGDLDKSILTISQKIRQNNSKYILGNKVSMILIGVVGIIIFIIFIYLIYNGIKYARSGTNIE